VVESKKVGDIWVFGTGAGLSWQDPGGRGVRAPASPVWVVGGGRQRLQKCNNNDTGLQKILVQRQVSIM